jgi:hypothetical protein
LASLSGITIAAFYESEMACWSAAKCLVMSCANKVSTAPGIKHVKIFVFFLCVWFTFFSYFIQYCGNPHYVLHVEEKVIFKEKETVEEENLFKVITLSTRVISKLNTAEIFTYEEWFYKNVANSRVFTYRGTSSSTKGREVKQHILYSLR